MGAAACVLLALCGTARAQVFGPAANTTIFPQTAVGSTSSAVTMSFTVGFPFGPAQTIAFSITTGLGGVPEYVITSVTSSSGTCVADGVTLNPSGSVCNVHITFKPAYSGERDATLTVASSSITLPFGLSGIGQGPQVAFTPGTISTVAGNGTQGYSGDDAAATSAELDIPTGIVVDGAGDIYFADQAANVVRKVTAAGIISTLAGTATAGYNGDGIPPATAELSHPTAVAVDTRGDVYIADTGNNRIREVFNDVNPIVTVVGTATAGYNGDNIFPALAQLNQPQGVAIGTDGTLYIADTRNNRIRKIDPGTGLISTVAGTGTAGFNGDGSGVTTEINAPTGLFVDSNGDIFFVDSGNYRVRELTAGGNVITLAGDGAAGPSNDGGAAATSAITPVYTLAVDAAHDVYFSDASRNVVRKVDAATGILSTVAGDGADSYSGDGGPATKAGLNLISGIGAAGVAVDGAGSLYIDTPTRIRKVDVQSGALDFASANVGSTSEDSPQSLTVADIGNEGLAITIPGSGSNPSITQLTPSFALSNAGTCPQVTSATVTTPFIDTGADCTLLVNFTPAAAGALTGTLSLSDDSLNAAATQTAALSGTGLATQQAPYIAPTSINFNTEPSGSTSNYWTVTFNNESGSPLKLALIYLTDPVDFKETNNCPATLPPYTNCNIQVFFTPSGTGTFNGALVFLDNGAGSPQFVGLTGVGTSSAPTAFVSPTAINFGTQTVATTSNSWTVTLNNTSGTAMTITSISIDDTADFSETNGCGTALAAHSTCTIQVSFDPSTTGVRTGTLTVVDSAASSPQTVALTGTGTSNAPVLFFSPGNIDFGNQTVGTTSNSWTVTLNNTTGFNSTFTTPIAVTGPFAETNSCGAGLAAHSTCNVVVTFVPTGTGVANGQLSVAINGGNLVTPVTLTGVGTSSSPVLFFSPNNINFGGQVVGTTSNGWTITLNNTTATPAVFLSPLLLTGPFTETTSCGATLAAYSTCNIVVAFVPTASGVATGQLSAIINGVSTPLTVALTGTGTAATPVVVFSPTSVDFGNQTVGTTSNGWTITLNNESDFPAPLLTPLTITGSSDFSETNNCGTSLAAHTTCNIVVTFTPSSASVITGQLAVLINGVSTPLTVSLTGTGTTSAPVVVFSPTNIDFGTQPVGTPSNPWTVTLNNESGTAAPLAIPLLITGDPSFTETNNCGTSLPAYSTCNIQVTFTPTLTGPVAGQLAVLINGMSTPLTVALTGTGTTSTPVLTFDPTNINFGNVPSGSASNPWTVTLNNESGTAVTFATPITLSGNLYFSQTNNCGTGLAAHTTCTVQVSFTPLTQGPANGDLVVLVNGGVGVLTVALTGTGTSTGLQFSPSNIDLGNVSIGSSNSWTITLNNTSNTALNYSIPLQLLAPPYFTKTDNCGTSLAAHSTCNIVVTFTPTITGPFSGELAVEGGNEQPQIVTLTGTGVAPPSPVLTFSQGSIDFGNQMLGTSNSWTVTLNNTGGTAVTFNPPVEIFASPSFTETNNCGTGLAAHSTCNIVVTFAPTLAGPYSGQIVVEANGAPEQFLNLTGTGVPVSSTVFFAPNPINFGNQLISTTSNSWTATLNNTGGTAIPFPGVVLTNTADFTQTNNCGTFLPAYSTCTIHVAFTPTTTGLIHGALTALIDGVTVSTSLTGTGTVPPDYTISVTPNTVSLMAGQTANATFIFTPVGGFTGTVTFYCTNLPVGVSCVFDPAIVVADGSNTVVSSGLTITTTGPYTGTVAMNHVESGPVLAAIYLLPGALLCGLLGLRRRKLRGTMKQWALLMVMLAIIGGAVGCGGFSHFTPVGNSVVTVTASTSAAGAASGAAGSTASTHTAHFTLNITQ